jgi:hypothetical protein
LAATAARGDRPGGCSGRRGASAVHAPDAAGIKVMAAMPQLIYNPPHCNAICRTYTGIWPLIRCTLIGYVSELSRRRVATFRSELIAA